jgi:hypothetical protein
MATLNDFAVGDKVYFGRSHGEQTAGTVMKVNRAKLKVRQDESRGTMKSYPVGTIWTVPPSLCSKQEGTAAAPGRPPAPVTGTVMGVPLFKVGDRVSFNARGSVVTGTVKRVNGKTLAVLPDGESDPHRYWRVSPGFCRAASSSTDSAAVTVLAPMIPVGTTVEYEGFSWEAMGKATVTGIITKVNGDGCCGAAYEVCSHGRFTVKALAEVRTVARRTDAEIVSECMSIYCGLSPENLSCDGECSRSEVSRRAAAYNRGLRALWKEAGRSITESECWESERKSHKASEG